MNCLNDEELEVLKESRESKEEPSIPDYIKPQPGKAGKLLWFSGPPGAGKSTTAQLLARNHGYVYYEADCMSIFVNPFIDINTPEPSMAQMNQKPLKVGIVIPYIYVPIISVCDAILMINSSIIYFCSFSEVNDWTLIICLSLFLFKSD